MKVVNKLKGRKKTLIMDPKVSGVLNQCIQTSTLKQHGIDQLYYLEPGGELDASVDDVVFFCRPRYVMMKTIVSVKTMNVVVTVYTLSVQMVR